jgi:hypothetical protein
MKMTQSTITIGNDTMRFLDTGTSNYMTGHKQLFVEMIMLVGIVSFGDASKMEVKEKKYEIALL